MKTLLVVTAAFGGAFVGTLATHALAPAPALKESFVAAEKMEPAFKMTTEKMAVPAQELAVPEKLAIKGFDTTFQVVKEGSGEPAVLKGSKVTVHATGVVEGGQKFWSTKDPGQKPFEYTAGVGSVITGWDQGCLGMKLGEVRKLRIPAHEGYGASGFPAWGIPAGGTLNFEIELLKVE